ncbi:MAG: dihydroorotate dehydrogenase electron transfer subunit, partial [Peptococcaceae bacterium]|nr:dihydroorotate dehydrogenase electron transfer subunit [Peptococcaceae bacterium]
MSEIVNALVVNQEKLAPDHFRLHLSAPEVASEAKPGQFLHLSCSYALDPLLRRPISIHKVQREQGIVTLFYRATGRGTAILSQLKAGATVNLLGPLGRGFILPDQGQQPVLIAGGMGIAPLLFLAGELAGKRCTAQVYVGAVTAQQLFFIDELSDYGHSVHISTDNGSAGRRGTVTALLTDYLATLSPGHINKLKVFACGPNGMLRNLSGIISSAGITGEMSLE